MIKSPTQSPLSYVPLVLVLGLAGVWVGLSAGQDAQPAQPPAAGGGGGGGGQGGGADRFAAMRQRMMDQLKTDLAPASDDEWAAIQPKIEKVMAAQRASMNFGGFGGRGGGPGGGRRGGGGGAGGDAAGGGGGGGGQGGGGDRPRPPETELSKATDDLRKTLDNKDASNDDIKAKVDAVRQAREKAKADLTKAQADLREILNVRQEAVLVARGMLE